MTDEEIDILERSAIMEYDGGLSREEADRRARAIVLQLPPEQQMLQLRKDVA